MLHPPARRGAVLAAALLCSAATGCLDVHLDLRDDGSGTMQMRVSRLDSSGDQRIRKQLRSPSVELADASYSGDVGRYDVRFTDVRRLRTARLLRQLRIRHEPPEDGERALALSIPRRPRGEDESHLPDDAYVAIDFEVSLPGPIARTNGERLGDRRAGWKIRVADLLGEGFVEMRATYRVIGAAGAAGVAGTAGAAARAD